MSASQAQIATSNEQRKHFQRKASEDELIAAAAEILRKRAVRLGSISDPAAVTDFLKMRLGGMEHELFFVLYLDHRHKILAAEVAFTGTFNGASVYPREILKQSMQHNAAAIICAHNHPSGDVEPSSADRAITSQLREVLALVEVRLLDHFVVSGEAYTSFAARGWL